MRFLRQSLACAVTVGALQAQGFAQQANPPPAAPAPPAATTPAAPAPPAAPSYPPPPANQPPVAAPAQPPAAPPPPGYQQPPPGYQQQPPPGYQQPPPGYQPPPPGYQPPPGYYQQPPPGYYQQPPPGYYPPTTYYPPPGYAPPPAPPRPPPRTRGFLAMPYLGFHSHVGATGEGLSPGATIGTLLGGRLNPSFSLNGELRIDVLNFENMPSGEEWDATEGDFAFSPLFHVQFPAGEFVLGPKFGFFFYEEVDRSNSIETFRQNATGLSAGLNSGVFFAVNRVMSLGGMLSFTIRDAGEVCTKLPSQNENCQTGDYRSEKVMGFHGAMLF